MKFDRRAFDSDVSEPWQRELTSHAPEYGAEFIGTAFLVFCVVGAVGLMFAPHSAAVSAIPSIGARLFLTGLVLGGAGSLVAITPLGRISGAHLNPAISLGFSPYGVCTHTTSWATSLRRPPVHPWEHGAGKWRSEILQPLPGVGTE